MGRFLQAFIALNSIYYCWIFFLLFFKRIYVISVHSFALLFGSFYPCFVCFLCPGCVYIIRMAVTSVICSYFYWLFTCKASFDKGVEWRKSSIRCKALYGGCSCCFKSEICVLFLNYMLLYGECKWKYVQADLSLLHDLVFFLLSAQF